MVGGEMLLDDANRVFYQAIDDHLDVVEQLRQQQAILESLATRVIEALVAGAKVLWCGNGGSAADSQHLAAEFVGRFRRDRQALPSIALTTDTSVLTAIGNDYGFNEIFSRQVQALCVPGDVVVGISTSGNSQNVCAALIEAKKIGAFTACFTGSNGGELAAIADVAIKIASQDAARVQEAHILAGHILCDWVELAVCSGDVETAGGRG
jgi:D-sedoheptulose 7-phosphate isomerase